MERLRAVLAGADRDGLPVQQRGHVVRVHAGQVEGHDAGALVRGTRAVDLDARHLARQQVQRVLLTKPIFPRYKAQLEAQGRTDLIDA